MKNLILLSLTLLFLSCSNQKKNHQPDKVVLAYVTGGDHPLPDPSYMTHINFAFGHVNKTFDGISIPRKERLREIVALRETSPSLKVLLSIGGWTSGGFSEMAATKATRKAFAKDCKRVVDEFRLDGIDMDWEYPSSSSAGITSSPDDIDNFTLLMKEIRAEIGKDKMLTLATIADAKYVDFKAIDPYIDLVNIMAYDVARPPHHHSGLYRSERSGRITSAEAVEAHLREGVPADKLVLGLPFYGHGIDSLPDFVNYRDIINLTEYTRQWDEEAKIPYMTNEEGKLILCYEDNASIAIKCDYIIDKGLRGAMYWEYYCDDDNLTLTKAVYHGFYK
ncbi:MAG: glycoside hydrolase [Tannerella sp.]|nr:glycoside hydrolase [Tannerella sp.]